MTDTDPDADAYFSSYGDLEVNPYRRRRRLARRLRLNVFSVNIIYVSGP